MEVVFPFFINFYQFFVCFSPGIFHIYNKLSSAFLTNSTFTNITSLDDDTWGGAVVINRYSSFNLDRCVFTQCKADRGGALYLEIIPYIYIKRTRFEKNSAKSHGNDIYVYDVVYCFNLAESDILDSSVCSTTPLGNRVDCRNYTDSDTSQLQNTCSKEEVQEYFFLFFISFCLLYKMTNRKKRKNK
jgi:hypothetical protein